MLPFGPIRKADSTMENDYAEIDVVLRCSLFGFISVYGFVDEYAGEGR